MKKLILILCILFTVNSFSNSEINLDDPVDCPSWAMAQTVNESGSFGGTMSLGEFNEAYNFYLNHCNASGGYPGDPTIL